MKSIYRLEQIDEKMLKYVNAYIKQVVNNSQKNYFRCTFRHTKYNISFEEYNDSINYFDNDIYEITVPINFLKFGMVKVNIESDELYEALLRLSDKQREAIIKSEILDISMQDVATQMNISLGKAYKHKRNAINILRRRLKNDEF